MRRTTILALLAVISLLVTGTQAFAGGTPAGTPIDNQATVHYQVTGVNQTPVTSTEFGTGDAQTQFLVDQKVDLTVTENDGAAVTITPGGTTVAEFLVENTGNFVIDILLSEIAQANGTANPFGGLLVDNFNSVGDVVTFYIDDDGTAGFSAGDSPVTSLDDVAVDTPITVYMEISADAALLTDSLAVYTLTGTAADSGTGLALSEDNNGDDVDASEVVFADGAGSDDAANSGSYSARTAFVVSAAALTVTKSVSVYDDGVAPQNPEEIYAIPGATMEYEIIITNAAGGSTAAGVTLVDPIPANTTLANTPAATGGVISWTAAYTGDPATTVWTVGTDPSATHIRIVTADIAAANNQTVRFYVTVDN